MLVDGGGKFSIHLVDPNGSREETVAGVVAALGALQAVSLQVFCALRERLDEQRGAVTSLSRRVDVAAGQVEALKGPHKRALRILSPAKYPPHLEGVLTLGGVMAKTEGGGGVRGVGGVVGGAGVEGRLGRPPQLLTADSFLLFNTDDNPYEGRGGDAEKKRVEEVAAVVAEEPQVPAEEDASDDFYYNPSTTSHVPQIDVPDILPWLPGIVDFQEEISWFQEPPARHVETTAPPPVSPPVASTPSTVPPVAPAPPPPPPPPPPAESIEVGVVVERQKEVAPKRSESKKSGGGEGGEDVRSNLMEAIRAAGGVGRLKTAAGKKEKRGTTEEKAAAGPDLMADLKHSLAMRRKGISGQGDLMERLAAVIPRVEEGGGDYGGDDDDEEEGEDDWD